jgi:hypothetical protein
MNIIGLYTNQYGLTCLLILQIRLQYESTRPVLLYVFADNRDPHYLFQPISI